MLFNGLSKGMLMLLVGAACAWCLAEAFQDHAIERTAVADRAIHAPSLAHAPVPRTDSQWMF